MNHRYLAALLLSASACSLALAAAPVTELRPEELADFVHQHPLAAVQFTTSDPECGYCVGADETFDQAAALNLDPAMVFARVQWPVYRDWPSFRPLFPMLFGVPAQMLFVDGSVHRRAAGKPATPEMMLTQFEDMLTQSVDYTRDDKVYVGQRVKQALTETEQQLVALHFRRGYLGRVIDNCGKRFPERAGFWQASMQAWQALRRPSLDQARRVMAEHGGQADYATEKAIYASEFKAMGKLQDAQGVPANKSPTLDGCGRVIDAIVNLP